MCQTKLKERLSVKSVLSDSEMFIAWDLSWFILRPEIAVNGLSIAYRLGWVGGDRRRDHHQDIVRKKDTFMFVVAASNATYVSRITYFYSERF